MEPFSLGQVWCKLPLLLLLLSQSETRAQFEPISLQEVEEHFGTGVTRFTSPSFSSDMVARAPALFPDRLTPSSPVRFPTDQERTNSALSIRGGSAQRLPVMDFFEETAQQGPRLRQQIPPVPEQVREGVRDPVLNDFLRIQPTNPTPRPRLHLPRQGSGSQGSQSGLSGRGGRRPTETTRPQTVVPRRQLVSQFRDNNQGSTPLPISKPITNPLLQQGSKPITNPLLQQLFSKTSIPLEDTRQAPFLSKEQQFFTSSRSNANQFLTSSRPNSNQFLTSNRPSSDFQTQFQQTQQFSTQPNQQQFSTQPNHQQFPQFQPPPSHQPAGQFSVPAKLSTSSQGSLSLFQQIKNRINEGNRREQGRPSQGSRTVQGRPSQGSRAGPGQGQGITLTQGDIFQEQQRLREAELRQQQSEELEQNRRKQFQALLAEKKAKEEELALVREEKRVREEELMRRKVAADKERDRLLLEAKLREEKRLEERERKREEERRRIAEEEERRRIKAEEERKRIVEEEERRRKAEEEERRRLIQEEKKRKRIAEEEERRRTAEEELIRMRNEQKKTEEDRAVAEAVRAVEARRSKGTEKSSPAVWAAVKALSEFIGSAGDREAVPANILMAIIQLTRFLSKSDETEDHARDMDNAERVEKFMAGITPSSNTPPFNTPNPRSPPVSPTPNSSPD